MYKIEDDYKTKDPENGKGYSGDEALYSSNVFYRGEFKNGKMHGWGVLKWRDGDIYVGEFENDKYNGYGIMILGNGRKFIGEWKDNYYYNGTLYSNRYAKIRSYRYGEAD